MPVNTTYLSGGTTIFSSLSLNAPGTAGFLRANVVSITSGPSFGSQSMDLRTNNAVLSLATSANAAGMTIGQVRLVFAASGMSLMYSSGATQYTVGESAVSLAQS